MICLNIRTMYVSVRSALISGTSPNRRPSAAAMRRSLMVQPANLRTEFSDDGASSLGFSGTESEFSDLFGKPTSRGCRIDAQARDAQSMVPQGGTTSIAQV